MQTMSGPSGIAAKDVFKAPNSNYQTIIYNNNNKWGTLNLKTQEMSTKVSAGTYQLLSGSSIVKPDDKGVIQYNAEMLKYKTNPSVLYELISLSTNMSQKVKNNSSNTFGEGEGWYRATWYPAVYYMKTKKFKSLSNKITYNQNTGRIVYMEFTEL